MNLQQRAIRMTILKTSINYSPFARGDQGASEASREPLNERPVLEGIVRLVNDVHGRKAAVGTPVRRSLIGHGEKDSL